MTRRRARSIVDNHNREHGVVEIWWLGNWVYVGSSSSRGEEECRHTVIWRCKTVVRCVFGMRSFGECGSNGGGVIHTAAYVNQMDG